MTVKLQGVQVAPARTTNGPLYCGSTRTEPVHVAVLLSHPLCGIEKIELWSGDGPGTWRSKRLAGFPTAFEGRAALFNLRLGVPWSPPRLTAVAADQRVATDLDVLDAAAFEGHLLAGVLRVFPGFASGADARVLGDESGKTLQVAVEEHRSLVTEVVRVPIDVVQLPPLAPDSSLMRALGGSTSLLSGVTPDGERVHVWETRVLGRETVTLPTLVARYRDRIPPPDQDLMLRVARQTHEGDCVLSASTLPVDPRYRISVVARAAEPAMALLDDDLLAALDHLLQFPGTRRVFIDRLGLRTSVSTSAFSGDTAPRWLRRVLAVSDACRRAVSRLR